jgi:hypothetical protein
MLHDKFGLSNPVKTAIVSGALQTVIKTDPPKSWSKEDRVLFAQLPPDIRQIIADRERDRDRALRQAQNRAAEVRKNRQTNGAESKSVKHKDDHNEATP